MAFTIKTAARDLTDPCRRCGLPITAGQDYSMTYGANRTPAPIHSSC